MIITNIYPYQDQQNAILRSGQNSSDVEKSLAWSFIRNNTVSMPETVTPEAQMLGIVENIDSLQEGLDLNLVQYPPFFPIATYQRMDLILEIRNVQQGIENSSLSPALKQAVSSEKLQDDATDEQISNVLDKFLSLRDDLHREISVSKHNIRPGSILKLEA